MKIKKQQYMRLSGRSKSALVIRSWQGLEVYRRSKATVFHLGFLDNRTFVFGPDALIVVEADGDDSSLRTWSESKRS